MATLLAFLAVVGMSVLGGWHSTTFHDDTPELAVSVQHVHTADVMDDHDQNVVHVAAHAIGHAFEIPSHAAPAALLATIAPAWPTIVTINRAGTGPTSLLRPPRA